MCPLVVGHVVLACAAVLSCTQNRVCRFPRTCNTTFARQGAVYTPTSSGQSPPAPPRGGISAVNTHNGRLSTYPHHLRIPGPAALSPLAQSVGASARPRDRASLRLPAAASAPSGLQLRLRSSAVRAPGGGGAALWSRFCPSWRPPALGPFETLLQPFSCSSGCSGYPGPATRRDLRGRAQAGPSGSCSLCPRSLLS